MIITFRYFLAVTTIDPHSSATGQPASSDIAPAIADDESSHWIHSQCPRRTIDQPRLRLAAIAPIACIVVADLEMIEGQLRCQEGIYRFYGCLRLSTPRHVRLVGDHRKAKSSSLQQLQGSRNIIEDAGLGNRSWGKRPTVANDRCANYTVTVEKHHTIQD